MGKSRRQRYSEETYLLHSAIAEIYAANAGFGDVKNAESRLLGVLKLKPNQEELVEAYNLLAQIYAQTGRREEAIKSFEIALATAPDVAVSLTTSLAEMFEKQKDWEKAIEVYNLGLAHCRHASLHNGLAYCLGKTGRLSEAENNERQATELAPGDATYANDLGYVLLEQGKLEQAKEYFERALQIDPAYELAQNNLALCSKGVLVQGKMKTKYTPRQGQYLAFIYSYSKMHRCAPAEADIEQYFRVAYSSVHQMIITLEKRGLISRTPGKARSIHLLISSEELPELK
ncbi:MAG: tetratricopeptide repeat protein [Candidatus Tectomicrobia bacterium]|uniref:Tetratricopeptide repeat protein n=1 Tax=Tectimicrobiota bacterium TaxID=2528274 RepID=A0A933GN30_UNCTE|nr:tetratricopeptide repeat protein [Candidatus Tectomicrobia bacterium]